MIKVGFKGIILNYTTKAIKTKLTLWINKQPLSLGHLKSQEQAKYLNY